MASLGIIMNGVSGRMGYRQHLLRSILAIRDDGGVLRRDGSRTQVEPILVGRSADKLKAISERHGELSWTTELDEALARPDAAVYFDTQVTSAREPALMRAIRAGKAVYSEKPIAADLETTQRLVDAVASAGVKNGVVHDKLYLPGMRKLRRLVDAGFFGRILSVRGEFGYWVFEGDWQPSQRPSWNYRLADGGGITSDMFCHWNYVLEGLFAPVRSVYAHAVTHIPQRIGEDGEPYAADADDAAYAIFELTDGTVVAMNSSWVTRVHRDELLELHVDGTEGSAIAGLRNCVVQHRAQTPRPEWNPDLSDGHEYRRRWAEVPDNAEFENGFKAQWLEFLAHVLDDAPYRHDFASGARGVRLAEAGLQSSAEGRRITLPGQDG